MSESSLGIAFILQKRLTETKKIMVLRRKKNNGSNGHQLYNYWPLQYVFLDVPLFFGVRCCFSEQNIMFMASRKKRPQGWENFSNHIKYSTCSASIACSFCFISSSSTTSARASVSRVRASFLFLSRCKHKFCSFFCTSPGFSDWMFVESFSCWACVARSSYSFLSFSSFVRTSCQKESMKYHVSCF